MRGSKALRPDASVKATNPWQRHQPTANAVIDSGRRVAWFTQESLTMLLRRAKLDDSVAKVVSRVTQGDRVVIDASGMLPAGQDAAEAFSAPWRPPTRAAASR